jgi:hypothetical protein
VLISAFVLQISFVQQPFKQSKLTTLNEYFLLLPTHPPKEKKKTKKNKKKSLSFCSPPILQRKKKKKKKNKMTEHFTPSFMTQQIP